MDFENMAFGERIRYAREQKGLSQKELADLVPMSQPALHNTENGRNKGSTKIVEIANILNVSPDWLLTGKGELPVFTKKESGNAAYIGSVGSWNGEKHIDGMIRIPYYTEAQLSAGNGKVISEQETDRYLYLAETYINRRAVCKNSLICMSVTGDSMEGDIRDGAIADGAIVFIDTSSKSIKDGKTYAFNRLNKVTGEFELFIKKLARLGAGHVKIISVNPAYASEDVSMEELSLIGWVFFTQHDNYL